jgi:hypothetical protein
MGKVSFIAKGKRVSFDARRGTKRKRSKGSKGGSFLVRMRGPVLLYLREDGSWTDKPRRAWHFPSKAAAEGGAESFSYDDAIVVRQ